MGFNYVELLNPRIAILICAAIIAVYLLVFYHWTSLRRFYWQFRLFRGAGEKTAVAAIFSEPYFKGEHKVIEVARGQKIDDLSISVPFSPKSIVASAGHQISVILPDKDYEYFPPDRCLNHINDNICLGNIIGLRISPLI